MPNVSNQPFSMKKPSRNVKNHLYPYFFHGGPHAAVPMNIHQSVVTGKKLMTQLSSESLSQLNTMGNVTFNKDGSGHGALNDSSERPTPMQKHRMPLDLDKMEMLTKSWDSRPSENDDVKI